MRIILHIGTDKTGSTAIQQHVALNRDWMAQRSVFVPLPELHRGSGQAALLNGLPTDLVSRLCRELSEAESKGCETALLSWEGMNFYSSQEIEQLGKVLSGHELCVLVYLREQADLIQTGLLQQHKSLTAKLPVSLVRNPQNLPAKTLVNKYLKQNMRDYCKLLQRWQLALPDAELLVRIYDPDLLVNANVVDDFFFSLGLVIDENFQRSTTRFNVSLDVESALLVNKWQQRKLRREEVLRRVDIALSVIAVDGAGSKYFLSESQVKMLRKYFRRSNEELADTFMSGVDYPFPNEKPCWHAGGDAELEKKLHEREEKISLIYQTPTLDPLKKNDTIPSELDLSDGWQRPEPWGVWSRGEESRIQFRVWRRQISLNCEGIRLVINGKYFGENATTLVNINGVDYGEQRLDHRHPGFALPGDGLLPYETVDIRLRHAHPVSPQKFGGRQEDTRLIAFGLKRFGYIYLWPDVARAG